MKLNIKTNCLQSDQCVTTLCVESGSSYWNYYIAIIFLGFEVLGGGNTAFGFFILEQLVELDVHHQHVGGLQVLLLSLHLHDHSVHIVHLSVAH